MGHNARSTGGRPAAGRGGKEIGVLRDLEVLTPSLVVCAAFLIGLVMFLRRQMSAKPRAEEERPPDIPDDTGNAAAGDASPPSSPSRITRRR
jgi:hypothetical protein